MRTPKILGIETEYGIAGGPEKDPILASSIIVNAYAREGQVQANWNFDDEHPDSDARGLINFTSLAPIVETHLANTVLTNGARFYVDHAHPEYSSPECASPLEACLYDAAGEEVLRRALVVANESLSSGESLSIYKNNSDAKGNSYGTHENYLVSRDVDFDDIVTAMVPHFVSRQILFGAGKVGFETPFAEAVAPRFQISQRAEFFEEIVGLETTLRRPIVNTRDEPHSDADRFRRLHVINGDANMSQTATFLKLGTTALLLSALEEFGAAVFPAPPTDPVRTMRSFSYDTSLRHNTTCTDQRVRSAWGFQDELWHIAARLVAATGGHDVASEDEVALIMGQWRELLDGVRETPDSVADRIDWIAKKRMIDGYAERHSLRSDDARLRAIDLQYHDIRVEKSLSQRAGLRQLWRAEEIREAVHNPPLTTRAYFRGECLRRYPDEVVAANWDSLVFDVGDGPLHRVPMMDPTRGTAVLTKSLLDNSQTAADLLKALESKYDHE